MFRMKRTRRSAPALLLVLVLFMGALPASAAGTGPAAGLAMSWEDLWSRFVAWASATFEKTSPYIDSNGGDQTDNSPYIYPDGQPQSNGTGGAETENSPYIDPLGGQ
jgi:hypothetical protein